jgi:glycosyltransferase involved in cell wall biosynthesis
MGKPLVMTDVSGAADAIRDGDTGLLVPQADADLLANAIETLANDEVLRKRLGNAGRVFARENLSIESKIRDYEEVFERTVEGR